MTHQDFDLADALPSNNPPSVKEDPLVSPPPQDQKRGPPLGTREWDLADALSGNGDNVNAAASLGQGKEEGHAGPGGVAENPLDDEPWDGPFMSRGYIDLGPHFPPTGSAARRRRLTLGLIFAIIAITSVLTALVFQATLGRVIGDLTSRKQTEPKPVFPPEVLEAAARLMNTTRVDVATQTGEGSSTASTTKSSNKASQTRRGDLAGLSDKKHKTTEGRKRLGAQGGMD
ncbi:hypothetical protein Emed_005777 [Eimeria media]